MSVLIINDLISKISEYSKDETNIVKKLYDQRYDTIYVNFCMILRNSIIKKYKVHTNHTIKKLEISLRRKIENKVYL